MSALPLLAAGAAAIILLGGKKKTDGDKEGGGLTSESAQSVPSDSTDAVDEEAPVEYGKVSDGVRKDARGSHAWRITFERDGYHAFILQGSSRFSPPAEEVGVAASEKSAKGLLRDRFNELLLENGYSESDFVEDPVPSATSTARFLAQ